MVDSTRGSIRIRSWPKPRPGPRHPTNEYWSKWLKAATFLYRYQPAQLQWQMQEATKGTVWMPRDIFISAARGRAWLLQDEYGRTWFPMAFRTDVSESLDAIAQLPGQMMVRGPDLWIPIPSGSPLQILTYIDDDNPPEWRDAPGGAYVRVLLGNRYTPLPTINVNSTTYIAVQEFIFGLAADELPFNGFRILVRANSSQAAQTITCQLALEASPATPLSAAGDDLVITNTLGWFDSGWIAVPTPPTTFARFCLAMKGSNATVDINQYDVEVHLRVA